MNQTQVQLLRPRHLPDIHWESIKAEENRLLRAVEENDDSAIIGQAKSLVESIARIAKEIAGEPAEANASFEAVVKRAHSLLQAQPGHDLTDKPVFSRLASNAVKMAASLGNIRNEFGTGHGRSRPPEIVAEMVELALDGAMLWSRWALRRLGLFAFGRPNTLMDDLTQGGLFTSGLLAQRLEAANIPALEPQHQRALGTAVGQRASSGTFVVRRDGVDDPISSGELLPWTSEYRLGVATGLRKDVTGKVMLSAWAMRKTQSLLEPIENVSKWVQEWAESAEGAGSLLVERTEDRREVKFLLDALIRSRPDPERCFWERLRALADLEFAAT